MDVEPHQRKTVSREEAEPGVLITTAAKAPSIGRELVARLIQIARTEKIHTMAAHILSENALMLARRFRFNSLPGAEPGSHTAENMGRDRQLQVSGARCPLVHS
jgi:L-amino acid N-acyltransferase YncA